MSEDATFKRRLRKLSRALRALLGRTTMESAC